MGAVVSRVVLTAAAAVLVVGFAAYHQSSHGAGTSPMATAYHASVDAARRAADAVFQAIVRAEQAAASYISAVSLSLSAAAADAVVRAAAEACRLVMVLIESIYGSAAAKAAKAKLHAVSATMGIGDVSTIVDAMVDAIKGIGSALISLPSATTGHASLIERQARSSTRNVMGYLTTISSSVETIGLTVEPRGRIAIFIVAVVAEFVQVITSPAETSRVAI